MADEALAPVADTPSPAPVGMSEADAISRIGEALGRQERGDAPPTDTEPEIETTEADLDAGQEQGEVEDRRERSEDDPELSEEVEEAEEAEESEEPEAVEVPDNLEALAAMFEVDPADLAGHIQVPFTDEDGNPQSISLAEAIHGNLRQADYSKKTEALAQERQQFQAQKEQESQALYAKQHQLDGLLTVMQQELQAGPTDEQILDMKNPNSPNYVGDYEADQIRYQRDQKRIAYQRALMERDQAIAENKAAADAARVEYRNEQLRLTSVFFPDLNEPAKQTAFEKDVRDYLSDLHPTARYSPEEIESFVNGYDARQLLILADAMAHRNGQKSAKTLTKKFKSTPKAIKPGPGAARTTKRQDARQTSLQRLRKGGGKEAAIDYIRSLTQSQR